ERHRPRAGAEAAGDGHAPGVHTGADRLRRRQRRRDPGREPQRHQQLCQRRPGPARTHARRAALARARPAPDQRPLRFQPRALPAWPRRTEGVRTRMKPTTLLARGAIVAAALALGACSILGGGERERGAIFAPDPRVAADPSWPRVDWQLSINPPTAART